MPDNLIELVILRHGEAGSATSDRERALTKYGRYQVSSQYQWLLKQEFQPQVILHSPYRRTTETALLANDYFPDAALQVEPLITPDGDPETILSMISVLGKQQILLVSHMPLVTYLSAALLAGVKPFSYPVAGLCWIQIKQPISSSRLIHKKWLSD